MTARIQYIRELQAEITKSWDKLDSSNFREMYKQANVDEARIVKLLDAELEEHSIFHISRASAYFSNIMAVGFAGYFATWTLASTQFSKIGTSLVALYGFVALVLFILFEIFKMIQHARRIGEMHKIRQQVVDFRDIEAMLLEWNKLDGKYARQEHWVWLPTFILTVALGICGALVMVWEIGKTLKWS